MKVNIITMSEVQAQPVKWLWYPYIPYGKITLIQGDPGDGKTTFVLAVAALLSNGNPMPECDSTDSPQTVIYQTAEDGLVCYTATPQTNKNRSFCSSACRY